MEQEEGGSTAAAGATLPCLDGLQKGLDQRCGRESVCFLTWLATGNSKPRTGKRIFQNAWSASDGQHPLHIRSSCHESVWESGLCNEKEDIMAFGEPLRGMLRGTVLGDMGSLRSSHTEKEGT